MANVQWASASNGFFRDPLQWQGGTVPTASDTAVLGANGGAAYTVVSRSGLLGLALGGTQTVGSIQTASNATLEVVGDIDVLDLLPGDTTFYAKTGGINAGTIVVQDATLAITILGINHLLGATATLKIGDTFDNTGTVSINGQPHLLGLLDADQTANLEIVGATTLMGGGHVTLSDQTNNNVFGASGTGAVLTNVNNTISGAGTIFGLTFDNEASGIVNATGVHELRLTSHGTLLNAGHLEATGNGRTLVISNSTVANTGSVVAEPGGRVILQSTDIQGGFVGSVGNGLILTNSLDNTIDGSVSTVTMAGFVRVRSGTALTIDGAIDNTGQLSVASLAVKPAVTTLFIGADGVTLTGGGVIRSSNQAENRIRGVSAGATLNNVDNALVVCGNLGGGVMTLNNETNGRIISQDKTGLTIDTGANTIDNAGKIFSVSSGGLTIDSAVDNTGLLEAINGNITINGAVTGAGGIRIRHATLDFASSFSGNVSFIPPTGSTATSGVLELAQSASYGGTVSGFSHSGATSLDLDDITFGVGTKVSYSGVVHGGVLTVTDGTTTAHINLLGDFTHSSFVVSSDGHGGTTVTDPTAKTAGRLATAIAQMPDHSASLSSTSTHQPVTSLMMASPGLHAA